MTWTSIPNFRALGVLGTLVLASVIGCGEDTKAPPACVGAECDEDIKGGKGDTWADGALPFDTDQRFILRERLDATEAGEGSGSLFQQNIAFSHRSRRWHVFPFTVYKESDFTLRLTSNDALMNERAMVWVYGPIRSDGSWPEVGRALTDESGIADVSGMADDFGAYVAVIGPETPKLFLPRYPGEGAYLTTDDDEDVYVEFEVRDDGSASFVDDDGERFEIVAPLPAVNPDDDAAVGDLLTATDSTGKDHQFGIEAWSRSLWLTTEDAGEDDLYLAELAGDGQSVDISHISSINDRDNHWVLRKIGASGEPTDATDPDFLTTVRFELDNGDFTHVTWDDDCKEDICFNALLSDGEPVPDEAIVTWKNLHYDVYENSSYNLELTLEAAARGAESGLGFVEQAQTESKGRTRYPIYFAHGFNSNGAIWDGVRTKLVEADPIWEGWFDAGDVPGLEPVPNRTEHLRRNLQRFLDRLEVRDGEKYMRLNVVSHSMGGLDSRYLTGHEKYNERCAEELCEDFEGNPEPCCALDVDGNPVMWRNRIVSNTTLSAPHCGSSFASWGYGVLSGDGAVGKTFRFLAKKLFGVEDDNMELTLGTLYALSQEYCADEMGPNFPAPHAGRVYNWECATGEGPCTETPDLDPADEPRKDIGTSGYDLPHPAETVTVFSWASHSCITGSCGDTIDPFLIAPFKVVLEDEGRNDGLVSLKSAQFGIFMGVRTNDHFRWNRVEDGGIGGFVARIFGIKREPADRFMAYWLRELIEGGY